MDSIGFRIKTLRKEEQLTQKDFAKRLLISQSYLSGLENGNEVPTSKLLKLICLEFGINEEWLNNGTGDMYDEVYENDRLYSSDIFQSALLQIMTVLTTKSNVEYAMYVNIINMCATILLDSQYLTGDKKIQFLDNTQNMLMNFERMVYLTFNDRIGENFDGHKELIHGDLDKIFSILEQFSKQD